MADDAETPPAPQSVYVYKFDSARYRELSALWSFYEGRQHDHHRHDWGGRPCSRYEPYLASRVREKGFAPHGNRSNHDDRRPNVPQGLVPRVINRFTDMTCGRPAALSTTGDGDSSAALEALAIKSELWDSIAEMETIGGACKSAAILPVLDSDGSSSHEVFMPHELYVRDWADRTRWIPREVIHQIRIEQEVVDPDTKALTTKTMVRTRLWDETNVYTFQDVDAAEWKPGDELQLLEGEDGIIPHGWGRCPIVWHQNIRRTKEPDGQLDLLNAANYELSDQADKVASHAIKATRANTEPTVVRKDRDIMFAMHPVVAKGVGNEIRVSEVGDASFLETDGRSVEMAWDGVDRVTLTLLRNCNCVVYDIDLAMAARGTGDSGEALMQRAQAMQKRCNRKRVPLERTLSQLLGMWLHKMREIGIASEDDDHETQEGKLVLPPRCYEAEVEPETEEEELVRSQAAAAALPDVQNPGNVLGWSDLERKRERYAAHRLGSGGSINYHWPPYTELTPGQVQNYVSALVQACGGKRVLSQQTGIELAGTGLGLRDMEGEKRRVLAEENAGVSRIQAVAVSMAGDGGDDAATAAENEGAAVAGEPADEGAPAEGQEPPPGGKTPAP